MYKLDNYEDKHKNLIYFLEYFVVSKPFKVSYIEFFLLENKSWVNFLRGWPYLFKKTNIC